MFFPSFTVVVAVNLALTMTAASLPATSPSLDTRNKPLRASVITRCTVPDTAALTFDDGPYQHIYEITRQLSVANASATFFFNGDNYGCIYDDQNVARVRHVFSEGHQVASHTWSHADLTSLSRTQNISRIVHEEMRRADQAIERITGALPSFFRPPYGNVNSLVRDVAGSRGQDAVLWDFDSGDSVGVGIGSQKWRYTDLTHRRPINVLTLNHEVYASTVHEVLPHAIRRLQGAGYRLVTVAECLGRLPYHSLKAPSPRDESWRC